MMEKEQLLKSIESDYSIDKIPKVEEFVQKMITKREYDFEMYQALLKLYQFYPSKSNDKIISEILISALSEMPMPYFMIHLYLIPENVVREATNLIFLINDLV